MQLKLNKIRRPMEDVRRDLCSYFDSNSITQEDIEFNTGVDQGQISKILRGKTVTVSKNVIKLCKYANVNYEISSTFEPSDNKELLAVIESAIAGSPKRAKAIIGVVKAISQII